VNSCKILHNNPRIQVGATIVTANLPPTAWTKFSAEICPNNHTWTMTTKSSITVQQQCLIVDDYI